MVSQDKDTRRRSCVATFKIEDHIPGNVGREIPYTVHLDGAQTIVRVFD
jgi:hypothetical protein